MKELLFATGLIVAATCYADILPSDRTVTWEGNVGIPGGIPHRTAIYKTIDSAAYGNAATDAASIIQSTINACPNDQVIYLPSGTYRVSTALVINHPIILRGAGANRTTLVTGDRILFSPASGGYPGGAVGKVIDWTAGYTKGDTVLTLASVAGLSVGQAIVLDQHNDTTLVHVPGVGGVQTTYSRADDGNFANGTDRAQGQMNEITAINAATRQITIQVPLYYTFKSALAPQVFFWAGNMKNAGIEDLRIDSRNNSSRAVDFEFCDCSWARGVEVAYPARSAIAFVLYCFRPEVRDCYIHDSQLPFGPTRYGVELGDVSGALVENNIISSVVGPLVTINWISGCAIAYNYIQKNTFQNGAQTAWQFCSIETHMCHSFQNLVEGNIATAYDNDVYWGSGSQMTTFRNRFIGYDGPMDSLYINGTHAVRVDAWNLYMSLVGNVVGCSGWHRYYELDPANWTGQDDRFAVYALGWWDYISDTINYDPLVKSTMIRGGNYDVATNEVIWRSNIPAGEDSATYLTQQTLPTSLYRSEKPAWWNASPWPPIGPEITTGDGPGAHTCAIPAKDCFDHSPKNPDTTLQFNADSCYCTSLAVKVVPPARRNPLFLTVSPNRGTRFTILVQGVEAPFSVRIFNLQGRLVKTLISGNDLKRTADTYRAIWTGIDSQGNRVGNGIYLIMGSMKERRLTARVLLYD